MQRCLESRSGYYLSVLQLGGLIISTPTPGRDSVDGAEIMCVGHVEILHASSPSEHDASPLSRRPM